jgi:ABC-type multidrug transport system fused ATPase/permease subunit
LVALGLALVRLTIYGLGSYLPALISAEVQTTMRRNLLAAFSSASWDLQSQDREGQFQEMMTNQITLASQGVVQATSLVAGGFTFLVLAVSAFALNAIAAIAVMVGASALFVLLRPLNSLGQRRAQAFSQVQVDYASVVGEANRVSEDTKVFGVAKAQSDRVGNLIVQSRQLAVQTMYLGRLGPNIYQSMIYIILIAGLLLINGLGITGFASLGAVVLILVRAGTYGQQVQSNYVLVRQALPYIRRVQAAIDIYLASAEPSGDLELDRLRTVSFMNVGYAYRPGRPVLSDLSFEVSAGQSIGVVGPSGAGKSTMVQILLRLRSPQKGQFLVNGVPTQRLRREEWNQRVAYVPQQPRLLHASVADNVRFLRPISDEAVERACRLARIHDEIVAWPNGYATIVGPRADAVSGGQQQRICLARALAAEPALLVLDEPTSALDPRSEALIQESLVALKQNLTLFIIAHRMSTLSICDRVMVIIDGKLDAFDNVENLRRNNHYYKFASSLSVLHEKAERT